MPKKGESVTAQTSLDLFSRSTESNVRFLIDFGRSDSFIFSVSTTQFLSLKANRLGHCTLMLEITDSGKYSDLSYSAFLGLPDSCKVTNPSTVISLV